MTTNIEELAANQSITKENPFSVCFVCLGNICRSPTAEGVFQHLVNERGLEAYFEIDSAGTSAYHLGESANSRSQKVANKHGIELHSRGRQFEPSDLEYFDLILAMDQENLVNIRTLDSKGEFTHKIGLLRDLDPEGTGEEVPDPYFGGMNGFQNVFDVVYRSCNHLLHELEQHVETENE